MEFGSTIDKLLVILTNMDRRLFDKLIDAFGNIYVLTMSNRPDSRALIEKQFLELGLPQPDMDAKVRYFYSTPFPYNGLIADAFNRSGKGRFTKPNEYDCARNHYAIIKTAYDLGWEHVLVIEDDVLFLKDVDMWMMYLSNIPEDFDVLQGGGFTVDKRILEYMKAADDIVGSDAYWFKHKHVGLWNASFYALSRKGMEFYLTFMDKIRFWVADGPLYKAPLSDNLINTYASRIPLTIQASKETVASDIRNSDNDKIDYDNQNEYERDVVSDEYFSVD
jgi:GR25 family glycosyltransferase involved in LPS biosynthesis